MSASGAASGLFLAFEGVEGAGKTTQVGLLAEWLRARGREVEVAREPGSTPLGERVRATVLSDLQLRVPPRSELFLMLAARAAFVEQIVLPGVRAGKVVIADRFELSTLAYQGSGRGLALEEVRLCNRVATGGVEPDATIFLDLDPDAGAARQDRAGKPRDRMEREAMEFHRRVSRGYRELARSVQGILPIGAEGDEREVHGRIVAALLSRFPETFLPSGFISSHPALLDGGGGVP